MLYHLRCMSKYPEHAIKAEIKKAISNVHDDKKPFVRAKWVAKEILENPGKYYIFSELKLKDLKTLVSSYCQEMKWKRVVGTDSDAVFLRKVRK